MNLSITGGCIFCKRQWSYKVPFAEVPGAIPAFNAIVCADCAKQLEAAYTMPLSDAALSFLRCVALATEHGARYVN